MNITVTLTANPDLLAALQALGGISGSNPSAAQSKAAKKAAPKAAPVEEAEATSEEPATESTTDKAVSVEEVRKAAQAVAQSGKRDEVKGLLKEFGVPKLVDLPAEDRQAFITKLQAI